MTNLVSFAAARSRDAAAVAADRVVDNDDDATTTEPCNNRKKHKQFCIYLAGMPTTVRTEPGNTSEHQL